MRPIIAAIMTAFTAAPGGVNNSFHISIAGRMYLDEAPARVVYPYCVFMVVSSTLDRTFTEEFRDSLVQFSLFSALPGVAEIADMYGYLKTLYDEKVMTISGSTLVWMREANLVTMVDEITTPAGTAAVKHWAVDFEAKTSIN